MPEGMMKMFTSVLDLWNKLDNIKKITLAGTIAVVFLSFVVMAGFSAKPSKEILYDNLKTADYSAITKALDVMEYEWTGSGTSTIYVSGDKRQEIITKLAQENLVPTGVEGWEIFNFSKWDETTFDKNIKLHRAMKGALEQMLMTLEYVKDARVELAIPKDNIFDINTEPVTASIMLVLKPGISTIQSEKVKGIKNLIARSVPGLLTTNISITDQTGKEFAEPDDLDREDRMLNLVERKKKLEDNERKKIMQAISSKLNEFFKEDRITVVRVALNMNWDAVSEKQHLVTPVEETEENPETPYPDRKLMENGTLTLSESVRNERFRGNGFTPGGPTGTEQQMPPGYRDLDYQKSEYGNRDVIKNYDYNRIEKEIVRQPWQEMSRSISVMLAGRWEKKGIREKENGEGWEYIREYIPPGDDELKTLENVLKASILYRAARGDQIVVAHMKKDKSEEFALEDEELSRKMMIKRLLIVSGVALGVFMLIYLLYRGVKKEMARRRRLREEELAAQQQLMREAALRVADEGATEVELSVDERARREMLENAMNLAREKPEQVAKLLRTWMAADE